MSCKIDIHAWNLDVMLTSGRVTPDVRAQYIAIIDSILIDADLETVSVKQVRSGIQEKVQYDITPHKVIAQQCAHCQQLKLTSLVSDQRPRSSTLRCS
jgi:hypothetical protein